MKDHILKDIVALFQVHPVKTIAQAFAGELEAALHRRESSLKMLPSYLSRPTGEEKGDYIAIDFGGSNVRVMAVSLCGNGRSTIIKQLSRPLVSIEQGYDLTSAASTGRDMFAFVAEMVEEVLAKGHRYQLGLTFSYPMEQEAVDRARLLEWTKEIKTSATVGKDIGVLLTEALKERGLGQVMPVAIINDTVAAFMAGAYVDPAVCAGSICGTGHNTCCIEPSLPAPSGLPMVVNLEAGNFALLPENHYDRRLDRLSLDPGKQRLEKMVSGKYLGELFRLVLLDLIEQQLVPPPQRCPNSIDKPYMVGAEVLSWMRAESPLLKERLNSWLSQHGFAHYQDHDIAVLRTIGNAIVDRAAYLIAATFLAVSERSGTSGNRRAVAVDGSVFLHIPGFAETVETVIRKHQEKPHTVELMPVIDGSNLGAAVAAAQAKRYK